MSKLNPIIVTLETVGDAVFNEEKNQGRRRPIMAKRPDGKLVVCCRHTARKHGWEIEGKLFQRVSNRAAKAEAAAAAAKPAARKARPVASVAALLA